MTCTILVVLDRGVTPGAWRTCALDLPEAELLEVLDEGGSPVAFERVQGQIHVDRRAKPARARVRVPDDLVAAAALKDAKSDFDRQKLASDDRSARRTVVASIVTAVITAAAAVAVALITRPDHSPAPPAPPSYRQLEACQDSLNRLRTLAPQPTQTLEDLRALIRHHDDACRDQLKNALGASS